MRYETKNYVSRKLDENFEYIKKKAGIGISFDVGKRDIFLGKTELHLYYVNGLCDTAYILQLMKELVHLNKDGEIPHRKTFEVIKNHLIFQQVEEEDDLDRLITQILSGLVVLIIDGENRGLVVDVRNYPGREPSEPETEKVIRGSRDGYTENIITNTALTRRRVRDPNLRHEIMQIGKLSKTDVVIAYIEGIADPHVIEKVKERLEQVNVDELTMSDKKLEEFIVNQGMNPYPKVRFTERPDILAVHLYQGLVGIMVDNSPSVIMAPTTFFDQIQHVEEYRHTPIVGSFLRMIRTFGILGSLYIVPVWMLFAMNTDYLPEWLSYIGPEEIGNVPIIAEIGIEFLRLAAIHTPNALTTAMGLIAGILVGQIAIDVGLFTPEVVLYVSISSLGAYATPSYELSLANKVYKLFLIVLTGIWGIWGLIGGFVINTIYLSMQNSFGKPYLYPLIPFNFKGFLAIFFRGKQDIPKRRTETK